MIKSIGVIICFLICNKALSKNAPTEVEKLALTCKVWGFLKYYHPQVATGKYQWDLALIKFLPYTEKSQSWKELNQYAVTSILSLGPIPKCESCDEVNPNWFNENFDLSWTDDSHYFSLKSIALLNYIELNRNQLRNHYAHADRYGTIDASEELTYPDMDFPNEKFRLLELFRFWNIVEYFCPNKYLTDQDWDSTLIEFIPKFINSIDTLEYQLHLTELAAHLNDSHSGYISEYTARHYFGYKYLPIDIKLVDNYVVVTGLRDGYDRNKDSLFHLKELEVGDVITEINNKKVLDIFEQNKKYLSASNESVLNREIGWLLSRGFEDTVLIKFDRKGVLDKKYIHLFDDAYSQELEQKAWYKVRSQIGYVNMGILEVAEVSSMMDDLFNCESIIFDLRNNSHDSHRKVSKYLNYQSVIFARYISPDFKYPGRFFWNDSSHWECRTAWTKPANVYKGEIVLLVNEYTQSHGEFTAMCLEAYQNSTIIGNQTAGADGNITPIKLLSGQKIYITGLGIYYPDGRETQRIGIVPEIVVKPTLKGIREGKDEVLECAIKFLQNQ